MFCISVNSEHNPAFLRAFLLKWGNVELILEECVFAKGVKPSTNEVNNQQIQTINIGDGRIPGTWIDESSDTCHRSLRTTLKFWQTQQQVTAKHLYKQEAIPSENVHNAMVHNECKHMTLLDLVKTENQIQYLLNCGICSQAEAGIWNLKLINS